MITSFRRRSQRALWKDKFCVRLFSSSNENGDSNAPKKRSGPVKLKETPRGAKARRETPAVSNTLNAAIPPSLFWNGLVPCDTPPPPFRLADYGEKSLYTLVLLRHGESEWNLQNRYTGWCDVNLTERGRMEARTAGRLLYENQIEIDHAFTSVLRRASFSCNMALNTSKQHWIPVTKSWRLNERHYGALQGYNKDTAYEEMGLDQELVMQMRRAYDVRPPRMENDHKHWHGNDRRYDDHLIYESFL
jgi:2,3-bisphosphoglycerate-dependent phosphoglycerate mutase